MEVATRDMHVDIPVSGVEYVPAGSIPLTKTCKVIMSVEHPRGHSLPRLPVTDNIKRALPRIGELLLYDVG